jgi:nucleotide-binding universal stress UspA family protein
MSTIVIGYDNSAAARAALGWATRQAIRTDSELLVVHVSWAVAEWELAAAQIDPDPIRREVERLLEGEWTAPVRNANVRYRTISTVGRVAEELMRIARAEDAALLVIGMTPRGTLSELVFGSTQHELQRHAVRPVVAVPASWIEPPGLPS